MDKNAKLLLLAISSALAIIFFDQTAIPVILSHIQSELALSNSNGQWVINSYLLTISIFLLLAGNLGDRFLHKRIILIGLSIFLASSIGCAVSLNSYQIILSRILQGIGAALVIPCLGTIIIDYFPPSQRGKAMGIYVSAASLFLSLGPVLGGLMVGWISWRFVFWINVPIGFITIWLITKLVPEKKNFHSSKSTDWLGFILLGASIFSGTLALMYSINLHINFSIIFALLFFSLLLFFIFLKYEKNKQNAIMDLSLFKNKFFIGSNVILFCIQICLITTVFWAFFLQGSLGYSASATGFFLLFASAPTMIMPIIGGRLLDKYGPKIPVILGTGILSLGTCWIAAFPLIHNYIFQLSAYLLIPGILMCGTGITLSMQCLFTTALVSVVDKKRGMASGIINTLRHVASTLGLALVGLVIINIRKFLLISSLGKTLDVTSLTYFEDHIFFSALPSYLNITKIDYVTLLKILKNALAVGVSFGMFTSALFALIGFLTAIKTFSKEVVLQQTPNELEHKDLKKECYDSN